MTYDAAVLWCCSTIVLRCYDAAVLWYCSAMMLQCYCAVLLCYVMNDILIQWQTELLLEVRSELTSTSKVLRSCSVERHLRFYCNRQLIFLSVQNFAHKLVHSKRSLGKHCSKHHSKLRSNLGPPGMNPARHERGILMGMVKKIHIGRETVKTVKTRKNTEWCENLSKSTMIWDQAVLSITWARNEIFQKFQNLEKTLGSWLHDGF